jgi:monovalent cation/hydrogen antiporter
MHHTFIQFVCLTLVIIGLVMVSFRLRLAYPIVLVLGGLVLGFTGLFPPLEIEPEVIFFIFLPPLLYEAAWQTTWNNFWKYRRVIMSFAFPIVILTSCVVAFASNALIPGFTLALGFLLGGIVSPPDAISATTIMRQVKVQKSLVSIVEGESLLNDASSLVVFRFALVAVVTGQFQLSQAVSSFFIVIIVGTAIGLAIAMIFYAVLRWLPTTSSMEIVLSFAAPYCMYYVAEVFHFSGVLAVVAGGLLLSNLRMTILSNRGRVQGTNVWSTIGFVLSGLVFLLIGLQIPSITSKVEEASLTQAIWYGLVISAILIVTRLLCTLGASVFTRFMSRFIEVAERKPGWKNPVILGWAGMRGVVSLAAALSIPVALQGGQPFPYRNLILIITFIVILVTLVFQGLTLPWVIRKLGTAASADGENSKNEQMIQRRIAQSSMRFLEEHYRSEQKANEYIENLRDRLRIDLLFLDTDSNHLSPHGEKQTDFRTFYFRLLDEQRNELNEMRKNDEVDEDLIRKYDALIDLEEMKLREKWSE